MSLRGSWTNMSCILPLWVMISLMKLRKWCPQSCFTSKLTLSPQERPAHSAVLRKDLRRLYRGSPVRLMTWTRCSHLLFRSYWCLLQCTATSAPQMHRLSSLRSPSGTTPNFLRCATRRVSMDGGQTAPTFAIGQSLLHNNSNLPPLCPSFLRSSQEDSPASERLF